MYAYIQGEVTVIAADSAVIEAGGVGYRLFCSAKTLSPLKQGEKTRLYTHLHLSEDVMALYGFSHEMERGMFLRLLSVTRVGPKLALAVLSKLSPGDVAAAIVTDNAAAFAGIPGMGKKTAQRVLLELKEKVGADEMASAGFTPQAAESSDMRSEAVAALVALGYDGATASRAIAGISEADSVESLITAALRGMARD